MSAPEVTVTDGKLRGKVCQSLNGVKFYTYKGIPYAKPPVGELRFCVSIKLYFIFIKFMTLFFL